MILLALGANLADREASLAAARAALAAAGVHILAASAEVQTPALLPAGAPAHWDRPYLNQVLSVTTPLAAEALLALAQTIEQQLGRRPGARWAPRVIDIDLLAHGQTLLESPELTLPHPRLHERRFVLEPLCEIAPNWIHPRLGRSAAKLLRALNAGPPR